MVDLDTLLNVLYTGCIFVELMSALFVLMAMFEVKNTSFFFSGECHAYTFPDELNRHYDCRQSSNILEPMEPIVIPNTTNQTRYINNTTCSKQY